MPDSATFQQQVKDAWAKLPDDVKTRLRPQIVAAHQHLLDVRANVAPAPTPPTSRDLLLLHSVINNDPDGLLQSVANPGAEGILTHVGADGAVYFGGVDYDSTDLKWLYVFTALAATQPPPFKTTGQVIQIPDDVTIAVLGDWGGQNQAAQDVAASVKQSDATWYIHLGDVYYAGTNAGPDLQPYESTHFLDVWPGPKGQSFHLNSNHDMYAHGTGYFLTALGAAGTPFSAQQGASFFALYNRGFRIVGLDSAYYAPDDLYNTGNLGAADGPQMLFLKQQAEAAAAAGQNLVLMTHHNGLSLDGGTRQPLWQQVVTQLTALNGSSVCWYWGHQHAGAVYKPWTLDGNNGANGITFYPRCCGHACVPWGLATDLQSDNVLWFETQVNEPGRKYFVANGYTTLALSGASMLERFYSQSGELHWSGMWPPK